MKTPTLTVFDEIRLLLEEVKETDAMEDPNLEEIISDREVVLGIMDQEMKKFFSLAQAYADKTDSAKDLASMLASSIKHDLLMEMLFFRIFSIYREKIPTINPAGIKLKGDWRIVASNDIAGTGANSGHLLSQSIIMEN